MSNSNIKRVRASQLKFNRSQLIELDIQIRETLTLIDDLIKEAHENGRFFVDYKLVSAFDISNMKSSDARKRVHANVISDLASRGFDILYIKNEDGFYIQIKWVTNDEIINQKNEINILNYFNCPYDKRGNSKLVIPTVRLYRGLESLKSSK